MAMDGLSTVDVFEKMFFVLHKFFISKLPSLRINFSESVGVELPDEAGEVVVLEIGGEQEAGELGRVPDDEARLAGAPRHDLVRPRVVHHLVGLQEERRRAASASAAARRRCVHCGGRGRWPEGAAGIDSEEGFGDRGRRQRESDDLGEGGVRV